MRIPKLTIPKRTTTRRVIKKAIETQDQERLNPEQEIEHAIRQKAYELYLDRGGRDGNAQEDWIKAEKIIRGKS